MSPAGDEEEWRREAREGGERGRVYDSKELQGGTQEVAEFMNMRQASM